MSLVEESNLGNWALKEGCRTLKPKTWTRKGCERRILKNQTWEIGLGNRKEDLEDQVRALTGKNA